MESSNANPVVDALLVYEVGGGDFAFVVPPRLAKRLSTVSVCAVGGTEGGGGGFSLANNLSSSDVSAGLLVLPFIKPLKRLCTGVAGFVEAE